MRRWPNEKDRIVQSKRVTFVMEQTLGHVPFGQNLRRTVEADPDISATWLPVAFPPQSRLEKLPVIRGNWSLRGSIQARRAVNAARTDIGTPDVYVFHTQVVSLLSSGWLGDSTPVVVSLDATPINYDVVGAAYGHQSGNPAIEKFKFWLNRRAFQRATYLLTWSEWARQSLIHDYGVDPAKAEVVPPGTNIGFWRETADNRQPRQPGEPVRLLFVGGDFERKGGTLLLDVFRRHFADCAELHLVTGADVQPEPNVFVHRNIKPNSLEIQKLFGQADIFVLPTVGDCLPVAITEAMASGLPVVSTRVGAIHEAVLAGETGMLITPGDADGLRAALDSLISDPALRQRFGARGLVHARQHFDAAINGQRVADICKMLADHKRVSAPDATLAAVG